MGCVSDAKNDPWRLERFVAAQDRGGTYRHVVAELRAGAKVSHWMWFVFPQVAGLGMSAMSREFAVASRDEARAYLAHPVLGPRLRECARIVADTEGRTARSDVRLCGRREAPLVDDAVRRRGRARRGRGRSLSARCSRSTSTACPTRRRWPACRARHLPATASPDVQAKVAVPELAASVRANASSEGGGSLPALGAQAVAAGSGSPGRGRWCRSPRPRPHRARSASPSPRPPAGGQHVAQRQRRRQRRLQAERRDHDDPGGARREVGVVGRPDPAVHVPAAPDGDRGQMPAPPSFGHRVHQADTGRGVEDGQLTGKQSTAISFVGVTGQSRCGSRDSITAIRSGSGTCPRRARTCRSCAAARPGARPGQVRLEVGGELGPVDHRHQLPGLPRRIDLARVQLLKRQAAAELRGHVRPAEVPMTTSAAAHVLPGSASPRAGPSSTRSPRPRPRQVPAHAVRHSR